MKNLAGQSCMGIATFCGALLFSLVAHADDKKNGDNQIASADTNYLGDKLMWRNDIHLYAGLDDKQPKFCVPAFTRMLGKSTQYETNKASKKFLTVMLDPNHRYAGFAPPQNPKSCIRNIAGQPYDIGPDGKGKLVPRSPNFDPNTGKDPNPPPQISTDDVLPSGQVAYVPADDVGGVDYRVGWDFGALAVPFKAQMTGKRAFSGSATVAGYLGYRIPLGDLSISVSPIVFAGGSNISVASVAKNNKTDSETLAGFSYGGGLVATVKDSFHLGMVVGFDHVDATHPYAYNDRPWVALELGYSFSQ